MKRIFTLLFVFGICISLCSCGMATTQTQKSLSADDTESTPATEPSVDEAEYTYYMKDGEVLTEACEPSADAVTLYVREACTVTDEEGRFMRFEFVPGREYKGEGEWYDKMAEIENALPRNVNDIYGNVDINSAKRIMYYIGDFNEIYDWEGEHNCLSSSEHRYAAEVNAEIGMSFTVTFDGEAKKLECDFADENLDRISYCGTGLREIEVTPDKVILRGDVVTETDEDQSELDPSERMHLKADGREIVIEPYVEK